MKHLKERVFDVVGVLLTFTTIGLMILATQKIVTDSAKEDKSVYEQVCDHQSSKIGSVGGSATMKSYTLEKVTESEDTVITVAEGAFEEQTEEKEYTLGWVTTNVNVREAPSMNAEVLEVYVYNTEIEYAEYDDEWAEIKYEDDIAYIAKDFISDEKNPEVIIEEKSPEVIVEEKTESITPTTQAVSTNPAPAYQGSILTKSSGVNYGPNGKETYYNLPMNGCIYYMQQLGYNYEYWVRSDGCKMYGDYIMIATNTNIRPKGTILQTSLGLGIVCDHCEAAEGTLNQIDIAVVW